MTRLKVEEEFLPKTIKNFLKKYDPDNFVSLEAIEENNYRNLTNSVEYIEHFKTDYETLISKELRKDFLKYLIKNLTSLNQLVIFPYHVNNIFKVIHPIIEKQKDQELKNLYLIALEKNMMKHHCIYRENNNLINLYLREIVDPQNSSCLTLDSAVLMKVLSSKISKNELENIRDSLDIKIPEQNRAFMENNNIFNVFLTNEILDNLKKTSVYSFPELFNNLNLSELMQYQDEQSDINKNFVNKELLDKILFIKSCKLLAEEYLYSMEFLEDKTSPRFRESAIVYTSAQTVGAKEAIIKISKALIEYEKDLPFKAKSLFDETNKVLNNLYNKIKDNPNVIIKKPESESKSLKM